MTFCNKPGTKTGWSEVPEKTFKNQQDESVNWIEGKRVQSEALARDSGSDFIKLKRESCREVHVLERLVEGEQCCLSRGPHSYDFLEGTRR